MTPFCIAPLGRKKPAEAGLFDVEFIKQIFQSQHVALMTEATNDANGQIGKIRMVPERLPGVHIG